MAYKDKSAQRAAVARHYALNSESYKKRARAHDAKKRIVIRSFIVEYLSSHYCVDCGEDDPVVLEFDHRDRSKKLFNIGDASKKRYSLARVEEEIQKCDVRCANCHRRKTFKERTTEASKKTILFLQLPLFDGAQR
jgi:hypothetical protein